jgi:hypothetical protein
MEVKGNQLALTGIFDDKEDKLIRIKTQGQKNEQNKIGRWLAMVFYPFHKQKSPDWLRPSSKQPITTAYIPSVPESPYLLQEGPPPRFVG